MPKFKRATATYTGPSSALRHHCNPSNTDHIFRRGEPLEMGEEDAKHYAKKSAFDVNIEYFPKKEKQKGKPKEESEEEETTNDSEETHDYTDFKAVKSRAASKGIKVVGTGRTKAVITEELKTLEGTE